jgi:hypothetical protein
VLAVVDMPAVAMMPAMMAAVMARASGMTAPVMDGGTGVMGPGGDGGRARPDGRYRGQNARNN